MYFHVFVPWQCLEQCFHAEGNGLSLETLHTEEYKVSVIVLCSSRVVFPPFRSHSDE